MKAPTKGQRFRLPEQLGGGEVEFCRSAQVGYGQDWTVTVPGGGPQFDIHPNWLTEVPPPIPDEPEPGAYRINTWVCYRTELQRADPWVILAAHFFHHADWKGVLDFCGGPDVSIVPLVPKVDLPEVTLPWEHVDEDGDNVRIDNHGSDGVSLSVMQINTSRAMYLDTPEARFGAAAAILAGHKAIEEAGRG